MEQQIHNCNQQGNIKEIQVKLHELETKYAVQESDIKFIKGDGSEMKQELKELSNEIKTGNTKLFITITVSGLTILAGIIVNLLQK